MQHESFLAKRKRATAIIKILQSATKGMVEPAATSIIKQYGRDPFLVLISCILSLRTRDAVSLAASQRLFEYAQTPQDILSLSPKTIEKLIYPAGFYRQKTKQIQEISKILISEYIGKVPHTYEKLMNLPGVGPKTTALVLSEGFAVPAICVDTHVHRVSNRLGSVSYTHLTLPTNREV